MNNKLMTDYIIESGRATYLPEGSITDVRARGEWVMFTEVSECGYYNEDHSIPLLDVTAWVYSKLGE